MSGERPTTIKKYANRRLYHTGTSAYVTLEDLAAMVRRGEDFVVQDAKTGEDITRGVLGQIIFDAESRGDGLLPIAFLRQLITFYDGQMHAIVPAYLEHSLAALAQEQDKMRKHLGETFGVGAFGMIEEQVRRNMDMFQRSMRMFLPFSDPSAATPPASRSDAHLAEDVAALRQELQRMQAQIDTLAPSGEPTDLASPRPQTPAATAAKSPAVSDPTNDPEDDLTPLAPSAYATAPKR